MAAGSTNRIFVVETKTVLLIVFNVSPLLMFIVMLDSVSNVYRYVCVVFRGKTVFQKIINPGNIC